VVRVRSPGEGEYIPEVFYRSVHIVLSPASFANRQVRLDGETMCDLPGQLVPRRTHWRAGRTLTKRYSTGKVGFAGGHCRGECGPGRGKGAKSRRRGVHPGSVLQVSPYRLITGFLCQAMTSIPPSSVPVKQHVTNLDEKCPVGEARVGSGCDN
jgi:hypothetical protein